MESKVREPEAAAAYTAARSVLQRLPVSSTFAKWAIVGGIGFLVNQFALFMVYDSPLFAFLPARGADLKLIFFTHPDVRLLIASVVAIESAILSNFYWHERWTFRQRDLRGPRPIRFLKFHCVSFGSPLIVFSTVNTLPPAFGVSPYIANTLGVAVGALWNWVWDNHVIWRR